MPTPWRRVDPILIREAMMPRNEFVVAHLAEKYPGIYGDPGGRNMLGLRETMSVTDYQALFVDVLDRLYYSYYNGYPIYSKALVKPHSLRDFRLVSRYLLDGVVSALAPVQTGIPWRCGFALAATRACRTFTAGRLPATSTAPLQYSPLLYQAGTSVNWRAFVNDDLGIFKDLSQRLALAANRGIDKLITGFYVTSTGLNTAIYQPNYHNQITIANGATSNNPLLNTQGLIDAISVLTNMRDSGGDPIMITGRLKLFYGLAYEGTVQNVMNAMSVFVQNQGGVGNTQGFPVQFLQMQPWLVQRMDPVMLPYMPIINTSASSKTAWGIVVDPMTQERPTVEFGVLNGFEVPQIFSKVPNTMRLGGGVDPTMGDFYSMDQDMKIVTVMGGVVIDGRSTVGSTGLQV